MADGTKRALKRIEKIIGKSVDDYVMEKLGYESKDEMFSAFMGLQVDAIAAAIWNIERGEAEIIADQTGVGKGRQAAAILRYALKEGKTPVFVTKGGDLFTDMYNDLLDIGTNDLNPLILNNDGAIKGAKEGELLYKSGAGTAHRKTLDSIIESGELPTDRNAVFMTYSQINDPNRAKRKQDVIETLAPNAIFVLDESHNAAGDSNTFNFFQGVLEQAAGTLYLSATYAKRPDNMNIYFRTAMAQAVDSMEELVNAIHAGGNRLQTVVANLLARSGQLFRRERSFDGISIDTKVDTSNTQDHVKKSDALTFVMRTINAADRAFHAEMSNVKKHLLEMGYGEPSSGNNVNLGAHHATFSSVVHNQIRQMLVSLRADTAADEAIESLKNGEKPVISVMGTMEQFLTEFAEKNGLNDGDELVGYDFRAVMRRALARSHRVSVKDAKGNKVHIDFPLELLPDYVQEAYAQAEAIIDEMDVEAVTSPIDWIRHRIQEAGYTVKEITGRNLIVDYSDPKTPVLSRRPKEELDRNTTRDEFNSGKLDVLILNKAGSTGISIHASERYDDQHRRHMIFAEPFLDINDFVQMMGRINRTGQVVTGEGEGTFGLPRYTILNANLPAEARPTAVLARKMKSLNANVSSNTESATSVRAVDLLNKYGDEKVQEYLQDNDELGNQLDVDYSGKTPEQDLAQKTTGRLATMPVETQQAFYDDVEPMYNDYIAYLDSIGQNDLKIDVLDLQAEALPRTEVIVVKGKDPDTEFGGDAVVQKYRVKRTGKPPSGEDIRKALDNTLGEKLTPGHIEAKIMRDKEAAADKHRTKMTQRLDGANKELEAAKEEGETKKIAAAEEKVGRAKKAVENFNQDRSVMQSMLSNYNVGSLWGMEIDGETYTGVVVAVEDKSKANGTNPYVLGKTSFTFMVNGGVRTVRLTAKNIDTGDIVKSAIGSPALHMEKMRGQMDTRSEAYNNKIKEIFDVKNQQRQPTEERYIVTGNLLAAFTAVRGALINYTKASGETDIGIMMPRDWKVNDLSGEVRVRDAQAAADFLSDYHGDQNVARAGLVTPDQSLRVVPVGPNEFVIRVPKSKKQGGKWFLNPDLLKAIGGEFVQQGSHFMEATVNKAKLRVALSEVILQRNALVALESMASKIKPYLEKSGKDDSLMSGARASQARGGMTVDQVRETLAKAIGWKALRKLEASGEFAIRARQGDVEAVQRRADKGEGWVISGVYDPKLQKTSLVAENLTSDRVYSVFLHEYGAHYGLKRMIGDKRYGLVKKRLQALEKTDARVQAARARVPKETDARFVWDEVLAYLVEQNHEAVTAPGPSNDPLIRLIRQIIAYVRDFLVKAGFVRAKKMGAEDIVKLVIGAAEFNARRAGRASPVTGVRAAPEEALAETRSLDILSSMRPVVASNLSPKGTAQSYAKQLRELVKQGAITQEQLDRSGILSWLEGFKLKPTQSERLDEQFLDIPAKRSMTINKGEISQFLASQGLMSGNKSKRRVNRDKLREMGMDFENLPGDEEGSTTRAITPVDEEPDTLDPEAARSNLRDQGFDSPDDEGLMSGFRKGVDYDTPEQLEALQVGGFGYRGPGKTYQQQFNEARYRWTTKFRQGMVDQFASLKDVLGNRRAWMMAQITKNHVGVLETIIEFGHPFLHRSGAIDIDTSKNSFKEILSPLGEEMDRWMRWVAGNRAERLKAEDRERLFDDRHIQALKTLNQGTMANGESRAKVYEAVLREYEKLNQAVTKLTVDAGLVNSDEAEIWATHGFYVPFFRMRDEAEKSGPAFVGGLVRQTGFKRLKGADIPLNDLLGNILSNWDHLISASMNNMAAAEALRTAEEIGLAKRVHARARNKKSSVWIRENGHKVWFDIEDSQDGRLVFQSLEALSWDGFNNFAMKALRKFKRALTIGVTISPEFRIANLFRDTLHSAAVAPVSPNIFQNLYRGLKLTSPKSQTTARMIAGGGRFGDSGYIHGTDPEAIRIVLKKAKRDTVLDSRYRIQKMWDWWQDVGARAENVNRAAAFEKILRENPDDLLTANFEARDLLDFSRSGAWPAIRFITQTVPFLNARMQGLDKLGRGARNQTRQFSAVVGVYALASVMLYLYMRDDDDFDEAEEWERDAYHLFKLPGSDIMYRLPRPFELGVIGTMMERFTEQLVNDRVHGELFAERLWHALTQTLSFNPLPQAFQPMVEVWGNRDMFTERPIESLYMRNLSPTERKRAWTSETAIAFSKGMDTVVPWDEVVLSPVQVEHLVQGYLGWGGASVLSAIDMLVMRPVTDAPSMPTRRWEDMPAIGRFVRESPKRNSKFVTQFYDNMEKVNQAYNDIRQARELGNLDQANDMAEEYKHLLPARSGYNRARSRLAQINKAMTQTRFNRKLSREEKRRRLDQLTAQKNRLAKSIVERSDAAFR